MRRRYAHSSGRCVGLALSVALMLTLPSAPAVAAVDERVQVRPLSGNATEWVSSDLYVGLSAPVEYDRAACCFDSNSGAWAGPPYHLVNDPTVVDVATIDWSVTAIKDAPDAETAALSNRIHGWPVVDSGVMSVPHIQNGEVVGTIEAYWAQTRCDTTNCAQYEGLVSFYIGNGIHLLTHLDALNPSGDGYRVEGDRLPSTFNDEKVREAINTVRLEGPFDARCTSDPSVICGGDASDDLLGTAGPDVIFGGLGDDTIGSGDGDDEVSGDAGNDTIDTGSGNDTADGGSGNDRIFARAGNDLVKGGAGNDLLKMAEGLDDVNGGGGRDTIEGGPGFDKINGGKGLDICFFSSRREKRAMKSCETKRPDKRAH